MDYHTLAIELLDEQYAALTDAEAAAVLNAETIQIRQRVAIASLQATAMEQSVYMALRTAIATTGTPAQIVALCQTALDLVSARFDDVDMDNPRARAIWTALQQAGVMTAEQATAIDALADATVSRSAQLHLGYVAPGDVQQARHGGY